MSLCHLKHAQPCMHPDCDNPSVYCSEHSLAKRDIGAINTERSGASKLLDKLQERENRPHGCQHLTLWDVAVAFDELFPDDPITADDQAPEQRPWHGNSHRR